MAHLRWILLPLLLACIGLSFANDPRTNLIGFVELPSIFGRIDPDGPPGQLPPDTLGKIPLHAEPAVNSPVIGNITDPASVVSEEFDYEERAAAVYNRSDGWTQLALNVSAQQQFGWMAPDHGGKFHPLEEHGLSYLTKDWDRQLYEEPTGLSFVVPGQDTLDRKPSINVLKVRGSAKDAWLLVELVDPGWCAGSEEPEVVAQGWIKLHNPDGRPNAWFYPRGC